MRERPYDRSVERCERLVRHLRSRRFCAPPGIAVRCRVATCAKTMSAIAALQGSTMKFVIGNPNGRAISTALWAAPT
jgi:hypothetical protein